MAEPVDRRTITLTRIFDAPREHVFALWTEAEHLARWWGPDEFTAPHVESDPRPGGALTIVMAGPGMEQTMRARYREVEPPARLVVDSEVPGPDGQPFLESSHTVTFADLGGRTEVTVEATAAVYRAEGLSALAGMQAGWRQSLQCLDDVVTGAAGRQVLLTRMLAAPPEEVFPLWVGLAHLERWWGPDGWSVTTESFDARPGGRWVCTMDGPGGEHVPNTLTYRTVCPPERLAYVHGERSGPDPTFAAVVTFDEMAGSTVLSMRLVFASAGDRDLVVEKYRAVEVGDQTLARLAALVEGGGSAA